jgi:hypothetical protein
MSSTVVDALDRRQRERQLSYSVCASLLATASPRTVHLEYGSAFREYQAAFQLASVRLREVGLTVPETESDNGWPPAGL